MQRDPHIRRVIAMEITSWAETAFNKISKIIITERHVRLYANALEWLLYWFKSAGGILGVHDISHVLFVAVVQLCPTQMAYWGKNYVTVWPGPHIEWLWL